MSDGSSDRVRAEEELAQLRTIWFAFLFAPVIYAVIVYFVKTEATMDLELQRWVAIFLGLMAGIQLLVVFVLKQMIVGVTKDNYRQYCIVRWAIVESIAIYGLVQHFMGAGWFAPAAFLALSFMMTVTMQPSALEAADLQKNWR